MSLSALLLLLCPQEPSPQNEKTVDLRARVIFPSVSGDLLATDDDISGDTLNLRGDLGMDFATGWEAEASVVVVPWLTLRGHYWQVVFHGSEDATADFFFGGSFYASGTRVDSSIEIQAGSLLAEYNLLLYETPDARWELGVQAGAEFVYVESSLRNALAATPFTETERFFAPLPVAGVRARAEFFQRVAVELWVHGGGIAGIRDARILALEGGAEIQVRAVWGLYLGAGWRIFYADATLEPSASEEVGFDLLATGPMLTVTYRF